MKKLILVGVVCGLIGFVLGNAFWYLASPLWIDRVVSETLADSGGAKVLAEGQFADADAGHRGKGRVQVIDTGARTVLRFTEFEVTNGPDLYVWLVKDGRVESSADVKAGEVVELGVLKGNIGDQNYALPAGVNAADYGAVVIWCRRFGVLFAAARLEG